MTAVGSEIFEETIRPMKGLVGVCDLPGNAEMSMMALALASKAEGVSQIRRCSRVVDVERLVEALTRLGIVPVWDGETATVTGGGVEEVEGVLDTGDSVVLLGCLSGLLAGAPFVTKLKATPPDARRVERIYDALRSLGARLDLPVEGLFPVGVGNRVLKPGSYRVGPPDTAVKCAVLLAGLGVDGAVELVQDTAGDDDLEVLLKAAGGELEKGRVEGAEGHRLLLAGPARLQGAVHELPGEPDAAMLIILTAALLNRSELTVTHVGMDWKSRRMVDLLRRMNVLFEIERDRTDSGFQARRIHLKASELRSIKVAEANAALFMDVLPFLAVAGALVPGETIIRDAQALREGPVDCISLVVENLRRMQIQVGEMPDGLVVKGGRLQGAEVDAGGDARVAMAFMLGGLAAEGETVVMNRGPVTQMYPGVLERLSTVIEA